MRNNTSKRLALLIGIVFMLNILQVVYLQYRVDEVTRQPVKPTAYATGTANLCINSPPDSISTNCNFTIRWGYYYACNITGSDPNNDLIIFNSTFLTSTELFNVTPTGNISLTANQSDLGNHTVRFFAYDTSGCGNNLYTQDYNITIIDSNHAPYLSRNLSNQTMARDASYSFFLNDYFTDPDGDNMTYIYSTSNSSIASIIISNDSQVIVRGLACGIAYVYYVATDPYDLSGTSNTVQYTVTNCPGSSSSGSTGGGGSGGGGGGISQICTPEWKCDEWSSCRNGTSSIECKDYHACDPLHYIEHHYKNCTYVPETYICQENWQCTDWSTCTADTQGNYTHSRACIDQNSCGTQLTKSPEIEACTPIPSCFNGIKDGAETEIDCGGECGLCKNVEIPAKIPVVSTGTIIASILTIITIAIIIYAFRKKISKLLMTIAKKSKMNNRPTYIQEPQKEKLLQRIYLIQTRFDETKYDAAKSEISNFISEYFGYIFSVERVTRNIIIESMNKIKEKELQKIIIDFYDKLAPYESDKKSKISVPINAPATQALIDEMLHNIYLISIFTEKDAITCIKERQYDTGSDMEACHLQLSNLYIALEFSQMNEARKIYKQIIADYEIFSTSDKQRLYPDIIRAYNVIKYLENYEIK